jgi:glyceraldehyde 3-phosphate dehydrogenase
MVLRSFLEHPKSTIEIVAINDLSPVEVNAHLLKYDSVHGRFPGEITVEGDVLILTIPGKEPHKIKVLKEPNPASLPWRGMGVETVLECSGRFNDGEKASAHIQAGAERVIISAPATNVDATVVFGVNHKDIAKSTKLISNASCTTNCLAPVAKVLHEHFEIESGYMTTIHAYTADQRLVDSFHSDPYRARASGLSLIPTTTGAARAVGLVLPSLKGKLDGTAIRVPTPNVSMIDFTFTTQKEFSKDSINEVMTHASKTTLKGVLDVCDEPLVSIDFTHNSHSSIFDLNQTQVVGKHFGRILSWYDNEWGFSCRMIDLAHYIAGL